MYGIGGILSSGSIEDLKGFYLIWAKQHPGHKTKKLVCNIGKYNNHKLQTNPLQPLNIYSNKTSERHKSKATSYLFLFKMIVKLGRAQRNAYQNKDKHRTPIMRSTLNNRSTTRELPPQNGQQPKLQVGLKCILRPFDITFVPPS